MERSDRIVACVLLALSIVACGGGAAPSDGGTRPDGAIGGDVDTADIIVSGARSASFSWDGDANYITCSADADGFFYLSAADTAGGVERMTFSFDNYAGPDTYQFSYPASGGGDATGSLDLSAGYRYSYFYNRSSVDLSVVPATCTLVVTAPGGSTTRIDAELTCTNWVANITSSDYDEMNAAGFRPSVSLSAQFNCGI